MTNTGYQIGVELEQLHLALRRHRPTTGWQVQR
jgi:hypothetical protein